LWHPPVAPASERLDDAVLSLWYPTVPAIHSCVSVITTVT
jgi:hypothetical protein